MSGEARRTSAAIFLEDDHIMPYADLPGVRLWYSDSGGDGPAVILLHAASGTSEGWVHQTPALEQAGYRCIAYDRGGWGRSILGDGEGGAASGPEELHALTVLLGLERFHLTGTAAGARPALEYALARPERVRSLVLADCGAGASDEPEYLAMVRNFRSPEIDALPVEQRELSSGYRGSDPEGVARWLEIAGRSRPHAARQPGQRVGATVTYALLETLTVPTLMLCGGADLVTPPALMRLSAAHIPGCRFQTVPEAGHGAFWEQPDVWNRIVLDFIGENNAAPTE